MPPENISLKRHITTAATAISFVAAIFTLTVIVLLCANSLTLESADPLSAEALQSLMAAARETPGDGIAIAQLQALDQLARRNFFGALAWRQHGFILIGAGLLALIVSLNIRAMATRRVFDPRDAQPPLPGVLRKLSFTAAISAIGVLAAVGSIIAALTLYKNVEVPPSPIQPVEPAEVAVPINPDTESWQNFRGPNGLGIAAHATPPLHWDATLGSNIIWKTEITRPGFSSPIVWGQYIFMTTGDAASRELFAYNSNTGDMRWKTAIPFRGSALPEVTEDTGFAAATPATDGNLVFVIFATGDLAAVDYSGGIRWQLHLGVPKNVYGHSSSLIVHEGTLIVQFDHDGDSVLYGINAETGSEQWRSDRDVSSSWASPVIIKPESGEHQVVLNAIPYTAAYRCTDGAMLWDAELFGEAEVAPSPAFDGKTVFIANEYAALSAVIPGDPAEVSWSSDEDYLPDVSSPVATNGILIVATGAGTVTAYETDSGEELWQYENDDGFYSSPILAGGLVYISDMEGNTHVLEFSTQLKKLAINPLGESSICTPAFVGSRIFIRGEKNLFCIGKDATP